MTEVTVPGCIQPGDNELALNPEERCYLRGMIARDQAAHKGLTDRPYGDLWRDNQILREELAKRPVPKPPVLVSDEESKPVAGLTGALRTIKDLTGQLEQAKARGAILINQKEDLTVRLDGMTARKDNYVEACQNYKVSNEGYKSACESYRKELTAAKKAVKLKEEMVTDLENRLKRQRLTITAQRADIDRLLAK